MSLESGTTLWRLNHELLPEPGRPIARTTTPFGGRCGAAGVDGTLGAAAAEGVALGSSASPASGNSSSAGSAGTTGTDPFTAAGAKACATACSRPRPPRPRPPRRRRPRPVLGVRTAADSWAAGVSNEGSSEDCSTGAEDDLRAGRTFCVGGGSAETSDCGASVSGSVPDACSASK
jgi:hypothetical protein